MNGFSGTGSHCNVIDSYKQTVAQIFHNGLKHYFCYPCYIVSTLSRICLHGDK